MATVLNWRLPEPTSTNVRAPLPWLPGIPQAINDHPEWGHYLVQRSQLIADLVDHVRHHAGRDGTQPVWAPPGSRLDAALVSDVAVWRAANGIDPHDRRPTGPAQPQTAPAEWQQRLDRSIAQSGDDPASLDVRRHEAATRTFKGPRWDGRHHSPQPSEIHRRQLPPGPSR